MLFGYIPTEVITVYVAVLAAIKKDDFDVLWVSFVCFLVFTPMVVWLVFGAKMLAAKKSMPVEPRKWPVWEMFAATIAFTAWAFALPNSPFANCELLNCKAWYSPTLAGVVVLVTSTVLGLIAPFFQRTLSGDGAPESGG